MIRPNQIKGLVFSGAIVAAALIFSALLVFHARRTALFGSEMVLVPVPGMQLAMAPDSPYNEAAWGTNSIFMHVTPEDTAAARQARLAAAPRPNPYATKTSGDEAWRQSSPFTGTNSVFFGANGGGNGWAARPQTLYGQGWSTAGHIHAPQDPKHLPSLPHLGGTNAAFSGADGYHYGWARKAPAAAADKTAKQAIRATNAAAGGWSTAGHGHRAQDPKHLPSVPHLGGTNEAFSGADGYHYGWARKPHAKQAGGVKHKAHPKLGFPY